MCSQSIKNEEHKIKQYIINPIEIGLWEATFNIKEPKNDSLFFYIYNFLPPPQQNIITLSYKITTVLRNMCYIAYRKEQTYDIGNVVRPDSNEIEETVKNIVKEYNINMIQNHLIIDGGFISIPQTPDPIQLKVLSLQKTTIDSLEKILKHLHPNVTLEKKEKKFSPKAILFQPYFFYTQIISYDLFSLNQDELDYLNRAIKAYYDTKETYFFTNQHNHEYEESIRMIGKAFESRLANIYETLLRKDASHFSSIGKLKNAIENEVKDILLENTNQQTNYNLSSISKKIYKKCKETTNEQSPQKIINTFKNIAKEIEEQLKIEREAEKTDNILFPSEIQKELENLLTLRNQVSHHNTTQSTQEDVTSMLFSYIKVYLWWQEVVQHIQNWDGTKKEIIEEFERLKKDESILKFDFFLEKPFKPFIYYSSSSRRYL